MNKEKKEKKSNKKIRLTLFFFYLLIIWAIYRFLTDFSEPWDELFFKPLVWLLPIWFLVKKVEKRKLDTLGLVFKKPLPKALIGLAISFLILGQYLLALFLKGKEIGFNPQGLTFSFWIIYALVCLATGLVEEITFRGYFMTRINEIIKDKLYANIFAGLLFFLIHFPILIFDQGQGVGGIIEYFLLSLSLGLLDGYAFWKTKGILAPIVAHSALNFFSLVIG